MSQDKAVGADWTSERWKGIVRPYTMKEVERLRGSLRITHTVAQMGAADLWLRLNSPTGDPVRALGVSTGQQIVQVVKGGRGKIVGYVSGWQTAADANLDGETYSDQSIYSVGSVPALAKRLNNALRKADKIQHSEGKNDLNFWIPLMADAEAGFGGVINVFELTRHMIEAGVAGIHLEDQLGSEKKCGHMGGKVLVPTSQFIRTLIAARLAADVMGVATVLVARTDAEAATLLTSEIDERDKPFILGADDSGREMTYGEAKAAGQVFEWGAKGVRGFWTPYRTPEGYFRIKPGLESAIARAVAYAPYCDMLWMETKTADLDDAEEFAEGVHEKFPGKLLMYNCSPSFNWTQNFCKKHKIDLNHPDEAVRAENYTRLVQLFEEFQPALGKLGYKFVFITLSGFHALNASMFKLAHGFKDRGMAAYVELQEEEFAMKKDGFEAAKHQREVGTEYYDKVTRVVSGEESATLAMAGSTEEMQFQEKKEIEKTLEEEKKENPEEKKGTS